MTPLRRAATPETAKPPLRRSGGSMAAGSPVRGTGYRGRIIIGVSGLAALLVVLFAFLLTTYGWRTVRALAEENARTLVATLAGNSALGVLTGREEFLQRPVQVILASPDALQATLYDEEGTVLYERSRLEVPVRPGPERLARVLRRTRLDPRAVDVSGDEALSFLAPVVTRRLPKEEEDLDLFLGAEPEDVVVGAAQVVFSMDRLETLGRGLVGAGLTTGLLMLALGVTLSFWLEAQVSRPFVRLIDGVRRIGGGDLDHRIPVEEPGEVGELTEAFNQMASRLKKRETELRRANEEMEEYVSIASHDLQSPLISIQGYSELLLEEKRGSLDPAAVGWLERIDANAGAMRGLIRSLLDFARTGRRGDFRPAESRAIVSAALDLHRSAVEQRGIRLEVEGDLPMLECDPDQLRLALANLVDNATKYIGARNPDPWIRVRVDAVDGKALFRVEDNGAGIAAEHAERIFRPMERLDLSVHGIGMGLALVRKVAEAHGGRVWVESTPGRGSCFFLEVPLTQERSQ